MVLLVAKKKVIADALKDQWTRFQAYRLEV
jgi:hypothetical protein